MKKWEKFTDEQLLEILKKSNTYRDALKLLGYAPYPSYNKYVKEIEQKVGYQIEHIACREKEEDLIGQKFNKLTILNIDKEQSQKNQRAWVRVQCDCGKVFSISLNALKRNNTKSCGCLKEKEDLVGRIFNYWTVLEYDGNYSGKHYWKCQCSCGTIRSVNGENLRDGTSKSCGCQSIDLRAQSNLANLANQKFGLLTVLYPQKDNDNKYKWLCECECGKRILVPTAYLKSGNTSSCGCRTNSYGEQQIMQILKKNHITFETQYSFEKLLGEGGRKLRFDFAVFNNNQLKYLIECQGKQHYEQVSYWQSEEEFLKQQRYDHLKKEYCIENNIPLVEIKYNKSRIIQTDEVIKKELLYNENN